MFCDLIKTRNSCLSHAHRLKRETLVSLTHTYCMNPLPTPVMAKSWQPLYSMRTKFNKVPALFFNMPALLIAHAKARCRIQTSGPRALSSPAGSDRKLSADEWLTKNPVWRCRIFPSMMVLKERFGLNVWLYVWRVRADVAAVLSEMGFCWWRGAQEWLKG